MGEFELGATSFTAGDGIYMNKTGTNNFRVGDAAGSRIQFTGDNLEIYNAGNTKLVSLGTSNTIASFIVSGSQLKSSTTFPGSPSGVPKLDLNSNGSISGSNLLIQQRFSDGLGGYDIYNFIDTGITGLINARNIGRQVVSDATEYTRIKTTGDDGSALTSTNFYDPDSGVVEYYFTPMPGETFAIINYTAKAMASTTGIHAFSAGFFKYYALTGSVDGTTTAAYDYYDRFTSSSTAGSRYSYSQAIGLATPNTTGSFCTSDQDGTSMIMSLTSTGITDIQRPMKLVLKLNNNTAASMRSEFYVKNITITLTSELGANLVSDLSYSPGL